MRKRRTVVKRRTNSHARRIEPRPNRASSVLRDCKDLKDDRDSKQRVSQERRAGTTARRPQDGVINAPRRHSRRHLRAPAAGRCGDPAHARPGAGWIARARTPRPAPREWRSAAFPGACVSRPLGARLVGAVDGAGFVVGGWSGSLILSPAPGGVGFARRTGRRLGGGLLVTPSLWMARRWWCGVRRRILNGSRIACSGRDGAGVGKWANIRTAQGNKSGSFYNIYSSLRWPGSEIGATQAGNTKCEMLTQAAVQCNGPSLLPPPAKEDAFRTTTQRYADER